MKKTILDHTGRPIELPRPRTGWARIAKAWYLTAACVAGLALLISNLDSVATVVAKWVPKKDDLAPFPSGVVEIPIATRKSDSRLVVEAIHAPKGVWNLWHRYYDVFLRNPSGDDVLLTSVHYKSRVDIPHGDGADSGSVVPTIMYELEYEMGKEGTLPLNPPFELKSGDLRCIRFYFRLKYASWDESYLPHWFGFSLIESSGRTLHVLEGSTQ